MIRDKLFIMRFNDGSATGQLKGIKKDQSGAWLVCDLTADGNDVVTSTCVSMATFSLTGVSLDDLLFVELYLKGDEGNTLWKWYLTESIDIRFLDSENKESFVFYPTAGSDATQHRHLVMYANGNLGQTIDVLISVKDAAGNVVAAPSSDYPPTELSLRMQRASNDVGSANYNVYYEMRGYPLIVTSGTWSSVSPSFKGIPLYHQDDGCVNVTVDRTKFSGGNIVVTDAKACIIDGEGVTFDQINGTTVEEDFQHLSLRWSNDPDVKLTTKFRVNVFRLPPLPDPSWYYSMEIDGDTGEVERGHARNLGKLESFRIDGGLFSREFTFTPAPPPSYAGTNGCKAATGDNDRCIRPFRFTATLVLNKVKTGSNGSVSTILETVRTYKRAQNAKETAVQEYWDHYPYKIGTNNPARINCRPGSPRVNGECTDLHPWPTPATLHTGTLSTNYGKPPTNDVNCNTNGGATCGYLLFGNYFDATSKTGFSMIPDPGAFLEDIRTQWRTIYSLAATATNKDAPVLNSGWRNPERNEKIGGVINSEHQWSPAVDVKPDVEYITVFNGTDAAPSQWCKLAQAADQAGGTGENLIENNRNDRPCYTPSTTCDPAQPGKVDPFRFQYTWINGTSNLDGCITAVRTEIEACITQADANLTLAEKRTACSPDHVHTGKP